MTAAHHLSTLAALVTLALPSLAAAAEPAVAKSGLPYAADGKAPKELVDAIRARRTGGKLLNLDRMLLHSPNFAKGWNGMFGAIRNQLSAPPKLRELVIMAIGSLNHANYEWAQHEPEFLKAGGTVTQLARLQDVAAAMKDATVFNEAERATLALTSEMTRDVRVKPATMKRIRAVLPDDQVVELIGTIAGYNMVSRFVVATGLTVE
ncbi:MAG: carboxymuconolactone decarboxylase family protein [Anaeromyxobacteraceae bacterium]